MAEENNNSTETENDVAAALPSRSKAPMVFAAVGILGLGAAAFMALRGRTPEATLPAKVQAAPKVEADNDMGPVFRLEPFIANLQSEDGEMHYLKLSLAVELTEKGSVEVFEKHVPRVRNEVLLAISGLKMRDVLAPENKPVLSAKLRDRIAEAAGKQLVHRIYMTEFVVQ